MKLYQLNSGDKFKFADLDNGDFIFEFIKIDGMYANINIYENGEKIDKTFVTCWAEVEKVE